MNNSAVRMRKVKRRFLRHTTGRVVLVVIVVATIGWGAFLCFEIFGKSSTDYDRAMADCISGHTQGKDTLSGEEASEIAGACANSMPGGR
jgi:hypothetical protein